MRLSRSHVVPEFFYRDLYDEERREYLAVPVEEDAEAIPRQRGIWERLLCESCEELFSGWETYARGVLFGGPEIVIERTPMGFQVVGIDYQRFKLFQLSLLWRCGVSQRSEFQDVRLGPHAERIREMLVAGEPGEPHRYGCWLHVSPAAVEHLRLAMVMPETIRVGGHRAVRFLMRGIFWIFFVSSHTQQLPDRGWFLDQSGELPFMVENRYSLEYVRQFISDIQRTRLLDAAGGAELG